MGLGVEPTLRAKGARLCVVLMNDVSIYPGQTNETQIGTQSLESFLGVFFGGDETDS